MNAEPLLSSILAALKEARLEAVLIGNAAAAMQGAPVTTVDFDFMFRATPANLAKMKKFAQLMDAVILRPYYPVSSLYRVMNDDRGLQVDFMPLIHGVKSFNAPRARAEKMEVSGQSVWVAHGEKKRKDSTREAALRALEQESEAALIDLIRRHLALPVSKRLNFLRVRRMGGSHL